MTVGDLGALGVAGRCTTAGLAGGGTCGYVITGGGVGSAKSGNKTATSPGDGFVQGISMYLGTCIVPLVPQTFFP